MINVEPTKYSVTQPELYAICRLGWANFIANQAKFANFSPRYTLGYCAKCMAEIDAAEVLPSDNARSGLSADNRILLSRSASSALVKWQTLKRYILEAYDGDRINNMLKIAGQPLYTDAKGENWQSVKSLLNEGSLFIKAYQADLVSKENMPPAFGVDFDAAKDDFDSLQAKFFGGVSDTSTNTQVKIRANNALYGNASKMLNDGQLIFGDNEPIKQQFVFSNLKAIVSGIGQAGIRGIVTSAVTGLPIEGAVIATANNIYGTIADVDGRIDVKGMVASDYNITVSAEGYTAQTVAVTVKTGTVSTMNVVLELVEVVI